MKVFDYVILILTITVSSVLILSVVDPIITGEPMGDHQAKLIAFLMGSILTIISTAFINNNKKKDD